MRAYITSRKLAYRVYILVLHGTHEPCRVHISGDTLLHVCRKRMSVLPRPVGCDALMAVIDVTSYFLYDPYTQSLMHDSEKLNAVVPVPEVITPPLISIVTVVPIHVLGQIYCTRNTLYVFVLTNCAEFQFDVGALRTLKLHS